MSAGNIGQQIINGTYSLDNRPLTAYEELKAWCEKHLTPDDYQIVPESPSYGTTIYFKEHFCPDDVGMICFFPNGSVANVGTMCGDDMVDHIEEYERTKEKQETKESLTYSPPPNSIGGQMVRKMIELYERQAH